MWLVVTVLDSPVLDSPAGKPTVTLTVVSLPMKHTFFISAQTSPLSARPMHLCSSASYSSCLHPFLPPPICPPHCSHTSLFKTQVWSLSLLSLPSFFAPEMKIKLFYMALPTTTSLSPGLPWSQCSSFWTCQCCFSTRPLISLAPAQTIFFHSNHPHTPVWLMPTH